MQLNLELLLSLSQILVEFLQQFPTILILILIKLNLPYNLPFGLDKLPLKPAHLLHQHLILALQTFDLQLQPHPFPPILDLLVQIHQFIILPINLLLLMFLLPNNINKLIIFLYQLPYLLVLLGHHLVYLRTIARVSRSGCQLWGFYLRG